MTMAKKQIRPELNLRCASHLQNPRGPYNVYAADVMNLGATKVVLGDSSWVFGEE
jgi:hypothetical protein